MSTYLAVLSFEYGELSRSRLHIFTLIKSNASWDVNVKQMQFSMFSYDISLSVEADTCVIDAIFTFDLFSKAATNDILIEGLGQMTEELSSLTLIISFVVWQQRFLILKHVFSSVRSYEHLW